MCSNLLGWQEETLRPVKEGVREPRENGGSRALIKCLCGLRSGWVHGRVNQFVINAEPAIVPAASLINAPETVLHHTVVFQWSADDHPDKRWRGS